LTSCWQGAAVLGQAAQPQRLRLPRQMQLACPSFRAAPWPGCRRRCHPDVAAAAAGGSSQQEPRLIEADTIIEPDGTIRLQPQSAEDRRDLWKRAIKLPMYSVGWAPILVSGPARMQPCCWLPCAPVGRCAHVIALATPCRSALRLRTCRQAVLTLPAPCCWRWQPR
jgi:hypothetical protein